MDCEYEVYGLICDYSMIHQMSDKTNLTEVNNMKFHSAVLKRLSARIYLICGVFLLSLMTSNQIIAADANTEDSQPTVKVFDRTMDDEDKDGEVVPDSDSKDSGESANEDDAAPEKVDTRTTAEKLEDLKKEVLEVNRDLFILEEDLLFPASTQMATYFSVDIGYFFSLDNIKIKIDDKQVTHHLYTEKDVDALYRGAIQKLHLDNLSTGEHEIVAILIGKGPRKRDYRIAISHKFEKSVDAKALEIQLRDDTGKLQPKLKVVEW